MLSIKLKRGSTTGTEHMALIVQKYGGTSVGDPDRIRNVAKRVLATQAEGHRVAVVVSAMSGETNTLVALAEDLGGSVPDPREFDVLVSTGEQKTIALLAMAIHGLGKPARSFTGAQMGMRTDTAHTRARIASIDAGRILSVLDEGSVAVIAGFQGVDDGGNITTLGRGGSDTSAVAIAAAIGADVCEIFTDVDGVLTTDPRMVPAARKLERISYNEMIEMASLGAKVLQTRSVRFAARYRVPLHVRSSFKPDEGTWVLAEEEIMEGLFVSGVTYNRDEAKIRVRGVKDVPGVAARIFGPLSEAGIIVDVIIQNLGQDGTTDVTFTVQKGDYRRAIEIANEVGEQIGAVAIDADENIAKVSIVGLGMKDHAGVASRMFEVLAEEGINIQLISTSEIKVSVVIKESETQAAVVALHAAFIEVGAADPVAEN
jgi:aspartate kinase